MKMIHGHAEDKIDKNRFTDAGVVVWEATILCTRKRPFTCSCV